MRIGGHRPICRLPGRRHFAADRFGENLHEGLALAERAGLDPALFADTVATGQAASPQVVRNLRRMVAGDHDRELTFSARLRHKDTAYAVRFARRLEVGAPLGSVALTGLDQLLAHGRGGLNESAVIEVARARRPS